MVKENDGTEVRIPREKLLGVPELRTRGWTATAIEKFLGTPDDTRLNPYYRSGPPMKFFLNSRVKRVEQSKRWLEWKERSGLRRIAASTAAQTKEARLRAVVAGWIIGLPKIRTQDLLIRAIEHYNQHWWQTEKRATIADSPEFLDRIQVNYLRHILTSYDERLLAIAGKGGAFAARSDLRAKVYETIANKYPRLAAECDRQQESRDAREFLRQLRC